MRKIFAGVAIVFLVIFTAGLAAATTPDPVPTPAPIPNCPEATPCAGNLWFVPTGSAGTPSTPTEITGAQLYLTKTTPPSPNTAGQPNDIWTGWIKLPATGTLIPSPITVYISTFQGPEDPHLFHDITGTDGASLLLRATGKNNDCALDPNLTPPKNTKGFGIEGAIMDNSANLTGSFKGIFFY
jgi:hypothetical protein